MPRIRTSSIRQIHAGVGGAASQWQVLEAEDRVARYVLPFGVTHLLAADLLEDAAELTMSFEAQLARRRAVAEGDVTRWVDDCAAVALQSARCGSSRSEELAAWLHFTRAAAPVVRRKTAGWPSWKSLFQLAIEHGDDSPVTTSAEAWLASGRCDWLWLRAAVRRATWRDGSLAVLAGDARVRDVLALGDGLALVVGDDGLRLHAAHDGRLVARSSETRAYALERLGLIAAIDGTMLRLRGATRATFETVMGEFRADASIAEVWPLPQARVLAWSAKGTAWIVSTRDGALLGSATLPGFVPVVAGSVHTEGAPVAVDGDVVVATAGNAVWRLDLERAQWIACAHLDGEVFEKPIAGDGDQWLVTYRTRGGPGVALVALRAESASSEAISTVVPLGPYESPHVAAARAICRHESSLGYSAPSLRVFALDDGRPVGALEGLTGALEHDCMRALPDGTLLAWSNDASLVRWDVSRLEARTRFQGPTRVDTLEGFILGLSAIHVLSPTHFLSVGHDGQVLLFHVDQSVAIASWRVTDAGSGTLGGCALGPDVAVAWSDGALALFRVTSSDVAVRRVLARIDGVRRVAPDRIVVFGGKDAALVDLTTFESALPVSDAAPLRATEAQLAGPVVITTANIEDPPALFDASTGRIRARLVHPYRYEGAWAAFPGPGFVVTNTEISAELWRLADGNHLATLTWDALVVHATGERTTFPRINRLPLRPSARYSDDGQFVFVFGEKADWLVAMTTDPIALRGTLRAPHREVRERPGPRRLRGEGPIKLSGETAYMLESDGSLRGWSPRFGVEPFDVKLPEPAEELFLCVRPARGRIRSKFRYDRPAVRVAPSLMDSALSPNLLVVTTESGRVYGLRLDDAGRPLGDPNAIDLPAAASGPFLSLGLGEVAVHHEGAVWRCDAAGRALPRLADIPHLALLAHTKDGTLVTWTFDVTTRVQRWAADGSRLDVVEDASTDPMYPWLERGLEVGAIAGWTFDGAALLGPRREHVVAASAAEHATSDLDVDGTWVAAAESGLIVRHLYRGPERVSLAEAARRPRFPMVR